VLYTIWVLFDEEDSTMLTARYTVDCSVKPQ